MHLQDSLPVTTRLMKSSVIRSGLKEPELGNPGQQEVRGSVGFPGLGECQLSAVWKVKVIG